MTKKTALVITIAMLAIVAWWLYVESGSAKIVINGQELNGPFNGMIGAAGFIVGMVAMFCAGILLLFVFAGIGIFILGGLIVFGLLLAGFAFPFLLAILLPLAIIWMFIAIARKALE